MTYSHFVKIITEADLSAEQVAKRMEISGMTVRRWMSQPPGKEMPGVDVSAVNDMIFTLIREKHLKADSPTVTEALFQKMPSRVEAIMAHLGIRLDALERSADGDARIIEGLSQIGSDKAHVKNVRQQKQWFVAFKKKGQDWAHRIETLWDVVAAPEINVFEKAVAFGALFFLLTPFDLIHDYIPVFGYLDDYAILGLAVAYYAKRLPPALVKNESVEGNSAKVN